MLFRRRFAAATILLALGAAFAVAFPAGATAQPGIYNRVLQTYQTNGTIPACEFTSAELQEALKGVDTYGQQYFADFTNAIQAALAVRATGACSPAASRSRQAGGASGAPFTPPPATGATDANLPAPILALAILTAAIAAVLGLAAIGRRRGWNPSWIAWLRHLFDELGYRLFERRR